MRDWERLVQQRLAGLRLEPLDCQEVVEELASHLDGIFEELRRQGLSEELAVEGALAQVEDWRALRRNIQKARTQGDSMNDRVKQFWLPGALTFALAECLLTLLQKFGPAPRMFSWSGQAAAGVLYVPWLVALPFVGAFGAYLVHRARGSRPAMLLASVFPILPIVALLCVALPANLAMEGYSGHTMTASAVLVISSCWVMLPGLLLATGGLAARALLQLPERRLV
jgi:hypothetical protein